MRAHWPEYGIEAAGLGLFMVSACVFGTLLEHPASPVVSALPDPLTRRALMGVAMGLTAVLLIYSPWGRRSGAHFNPATTLTFWRLGKVETRDAVGGTLAHPGVRYVATVPGPGGTAVAFAAEVAIAFILMSVVLRVSNDAALA